ncbi:MAG: hypothetical protein RLZZ385_787 [Pseudomonadota bacterium]|jgi:riboflavin synthase
MFTGIIAAVGDIRRREKHNDEWRLTIGCGRLDLADVALGDSIAVSGACLTVVALPGDGFAADVSNETMALTTLGDLQIGSAVNLEKALTLSSRLGGHLVTGHVDGVGILKDMGPDGGSIRMRFEAPAPLARYIAAKGSICIDGTSLTVNTVEGAEFTVNIIPHTQTETIIQYYRPGHRVNLEVDLVSRYLERLVLGEAAATTPGLSREFLKRHGFDS